MPDTGTGRSNRASRWKQLLVTLDNVIAALDARLGRESASTLNRFARRSAPATRSRDRRDAWRTASLAISHSADRMGMMGAWMRRASERGASERGADVGDRLTWLELRDASIASSQKVRGWNRPASPRRPDSDEPDGSHPANGLDRK
jgi:hypothetical protein